MALGDGLGEGWMQAGGGFRLGSSFQLGTAKPIGGGGGERTRGPTGEADEAAARLAAMERRLAAKMAALDAAIARLEGNQAAMLRREEDALRPELPEPLSGLAFAPENADVLNGTGVETKPESRDHDGGKNDLFRYKIAMSDGEHGFWMPLTFLSGSGGGGGGVWNGKVYDFFGNLVRDFTDPTNEENQWQGCVNENGVWVIHGTHVKVQVYYDFANHVVSNIEATMYIDSANRSTPFSDAMYFKVADMATVSEGGHDRTVYTLTSDQAGSIRLPFPLYSGMEIFANQVLQIPSTSPHLPYFNYVRAIGDYYS